MKKPIFQRIHAYFCQSAAILFFLVSLGCGQPSSTPTLPPAATPDVPPESAFRDEEIPERFLNELREAAANGESWTQSMLGVALRLARISQGEEISETPRHVITITLVPALKEVTLLERGIPDDSTYVEYARITFERSEDRKTWIPIRHRTSVQGRGASGWVPGPTL